MPSLQTPPKAEPSVLSVSVKSLCAFGAKRGDLDFRFVPAPTGQEGIAGHLLVQGRRGPEYQREVALTATIGGLRLRGRADGYDPVSGRLEEIKTHRGAVDRIAANRQALHWAQAKAYAAMLCERDALPGLTVALVYLDLATGEETVLEAACTRDELRSQLEALCADYIAWARQEQRHRALRAERLDALAFPHRGFRPGQRELAANVYRAAASGRCLIAQAPTGIGKTVATFFPLLRGWRRHGMDKLFFLTAKNAGKPVAWQALQRIEPDEGGTLRVVELTARANACERPGAACHGASCGLARGFYDRLGAARAEAVQARRLDRPRLRAIALTHGICPYYLAQEMARWADVVVADYTAWFDGSAMLYALAKEEEWRAAVLVDEAHNLLERARAMYSCTVDAARLAQAVALAPPAVRPALAGLQQAWRRLRAAQPDVYVAADAVPPPLQRALQEALAALAEHAAERGHDMAGELAAGGAGLPYDAKPDAASDAGGALQQCFFELLAFSRLAEAFGPHAVFERVRSEDGAAESFGIRNLVPAPFLRGRFAASLTTVCFSGTIAPFHFYRDLLGLPEDAAQLAVDSPFKPEQLQVHVATDVSTRFQHRERSLPQVVAHIAGQYAARPGNYMAFFSSFAYLARAHALLAERHPEVPSWKQHGGMTPAEQDDFVARFRAGGRGIGFAVLGGAFSEGVDLPGDRLSGAFIATLGMPQHDAVNEVTRERMEALFGQGYDYTYLFPGLRKVVQAAGRVIRSENDTGVLHLLDDRFARAEVRRLLPAWWDLGAAAHGR